MSISSINSFKTISLVNFKGEEKKTPSPFIGSSEPVKDIFASADNSVKSSFVSNAFFNLTKLGKASLLSIAVLFGMTSCPSPNNDHTSSAVSQAPTPTPTPTPDPGTKVGNSAFTKVLNLLNPIIQDSSGNVITDTPAPDLSLDSIDSWSHDSATGGFNLHEVVTIQSIDPITGIAKAKIDDVYSGNQNSTASVVVDLVKVDDNTARLKFSDNQYIDFKSIDNGVRQSSYYNSSLLYEFDLKPLSQGVDGEYIAGTSTKIAEWTNVIVKLTEKATAALKALKK